MGHFKRNQAVCFILLLVISIQGISCSDNEPNTEDDPYALWKEQPNERIVFMSRADSPEGELYLLEKNGQITRLTDNNRHENNPAISPDGKKVAFNGGDEGSMLTWEIFILDLETNEETQLTENSVIDAHPDWSPDGSRIVFGSFRDAQGNPFGTADIYAMNSSDGSELARLTDSPWEDNDPEWSPDGTRIVFKSTRNTQQSGREEIYIMSSDGADPQRLTTTSGWESDHDPSWSPHSDLILFIRFEGSRAWFDIADFANDWEELTPWNVHRVNLGGNVERLTNSSDAGWGVVLFSTDASQILFGTIHWIINDGNQVIGGLHRLILMNPNGSNQRQLLRDDNHTGTLEYFDW
ncbi:hypothetical protein KJ815_04180 [bacterium]|nr:hypothetical protein [bacterium]